MELPILQHIPIIHWLLQNKVESVWLVDPHISIPGINMNPYATKVIQGKKNC